MVIKHEDSLTPPGYWGSDISCIHTYENFITQEESMALNCYIRTNKIWQQNASHEIWNNRVHDSSMFTELEVKKKAQEIIDRIQNKIENVLDVELNSNGPSIVRWLVNNGQAPHADKQLPDGTPNMYPQNDISSLIYLNDDYQGGKIFFPNQKIEFKPIKNSLIFFPGDINFLHGVTTVTGGVRYTMPSFWKVKAIR